jgi:hypothetical protein
MFSNDLEIFYNYTEKSIYKTEYEKVPEKDGYLKIPYSSNTPNIVLSSAKSTTNYIATNLYIFAADKTRISKYDYQAIMVIEHQSATNGFRTLYTCFPLATDPLPKGIRNPIDDMIKGVEMTTLNLNRLIKENTKTAVYENKGLLYNDTVVVFDKPIYLTRPLAEFSTPPTMFSELSHIKDVPCMAQIHERSGGTETGTNEGTMEGIREGFVVEGMADVPVFCTPIDEIEDAAEFTDQIVMPAIGPLSESIKSASLLNYALNFISFFVILISVYFLVPAVYLYAFAAKIVEHTDIEDLMNKPGDGVGIPFLIAMAFYITGAILLITSGDQTSLYFGIIFLIIFCLSFLILYAKNNPIYKFGFGFLGINKFMNLFFGGGFIGGAVLSSLLVFLLPGTGDNKTAKSAITIFCAITGGIIGQLLTKDNIATAPA